MYDLADYLADNYGECALGQQRCEETNRLGRCPLRADGLGRFCQHWKPLGTKNLEEQFDRIFGGEK